MHAAQKICGWMVDHGRRLLAACLLTLLPMFLLNACEGESTPEIPSKLYSISLEDCDDYKASISTRRNRCSPSFSIDIDADGSYQMDGSYCVSSEICKDKLTPSEMLSLRQTLHAFDFSSFMNDPNSCPSSSTITKYHIELSQEKQTFNFARHEACENTLRDLQLRRFNASLLAIINPGRYIRLFPPPPDFTGCKWMELQSSEMWKDGARVVVNIKIDPQGKVTRASVIRSSGRREIDNAAAELVKKCRFQPPTSNGKPYSTEMDVDYAWDAKKQGIQIR